MNNFAFICLFPLDLLDIQLQPGQQTSSSIHILCFILSCTPTHTHPHHHHRVTVVCPPWSSSDRTITCHLAWRFRTHLACSAMTGFCCCSPSTVWDVTRPEIKYVAFNHAPAAKVIRRKKCGYPCLCLITRLLLDFSEVRQTSP